jgi:mycothiol synthase
MTAPRPAQPNDRPHKLRMRLPSFAVLKAPPPHGEEVVIRAAGAADAEAVAAVLAAAFADARWTPDLVRRVLLENAEVIAVFVAEQHGHAVATASSRLLPGRFPGSGVLHWVGVHPDAVRHDFGRLVSHAALVRLREHGCRDAVLETDDFRVAAIHLYMTFGFVPEPCAPGHEERWASVMSRI